MVAADNQVKASIQNYKSEIYLPLVSSIYFYVLKCTVLIDSEYENIFFM